MDGIKVKQDGLAKYIRDLAGEDCSIGLHEIGLNSLSFSLFVYLVPIFFSGVETNTQRH